MSWTRSSSARFVSKDFIRIGLQKVKMFTIPGTQKMLVREVVRSAHDPSGSSEGSIYLDVDVSIGREASIQHGGAPGPKFSRG
jgi:hypothetical protein